MSQKGSSEKILGKKNKIMGIPVLYVAVFILLFVIPSSVIGGTSGQTIGMDLVNSISGMFTGGGVVPGGAYVGNVQFIINRNDRLASGAVTPTSDAYTLFHGNPSIGDTGIAITASGTTTEITVEDQGIVYMTLYGGTDFYICEDGFRNSNPKVMSTEWRDYDQDGDEDFIAKLDVSQVGVTGQEQTPTFTLTLPLLDEDVASFADDSPSDITGIGETEVVQAVVWKLSGITAEDGAFMTRLYFATNDTRGGDDVRLEEVTLSGGWVTSSGCKTYYASPVKEENGDYEAWYINPTDYLEYHQGERVWRDTNEADSMYVTLNVRCTFETNDRVQITLYADFLDPDGSSITSVSDAVVLDEA